MVQCEMCGAETSSPTTITVEGAELEVCDDCTDFGTTVRTDDTESTSTKYSTSTGGSSGSSAGGGSSGGSSGGPTPGSDMYDDVDELATDYNERIREAREAAELSQSDLAEQLNLKASLIRKLEHGDTLPSDDVQRQLERALDISLSGGAGETDTEWESDDAGDGLTLGDMVKRRD